MSKGSQTADKVWSKYLDRLSAYRTNYIRDCFHKMSRILLEWCKEHEIGTLVLGSNTFWKQDANMGKQNNQSFVSIPFDMLKNMIELKVCEYGITVTRTEESYTSKASFLDHDEIPVYVSGSNKEYSFSGFSGKRTKRGLYRSSDGTLINSDLNGASNILRKAGYDTSCVQLSRLLYPKIIRFADLNSK